MSSVLRSGGSRIAADDAQSGRWLSAKPASMSDILASASSDLGQDTDADRPEWWRQSASAVKHAATPLLPVQIDRSRQLASLDPVVMPSPPPERLEFSAVFRLGAAVAVLSCIAFITMRLMQDPKTATAAKLDIAVSSSRNIGLTGSRLEDGLAAADVNRPADPIVASVPAVKPAPNGRETAQSSPPKASRVIATASPAPVAPAGLSRDEISDMLARGRDLIGAGDVASARLILAHVAEGDAEASLMLAGTYDPAVLSKVKAVGVAPDLATARAWYKRAAELGSAEARRRLE